MKLSIAANYLLSTITLSNVTAQHLREAKHVSPKDSSEEWVHFDVHSKTNTAHVEDRGANNLSYAEVRTANFLNLKEGDADQVDVPRRLKKEKNGKKKKDKKGSEKKKRKNKKGKGSMKAT